MKKALNLQQGRPYIALVNLPEKARTRNRGFFTGLILPIHIHTVISSLYIHGWCCCM